MNHLKTVTVIDAMIDAAIEATAMAHPDKIVCADVSPIENGLTVVRISVLDEPLPDKELSGKLVTYHKP